MDLSRSSNSIQLHQRLRFPQKNVQEAQESLLEIAPAHKAVSKEDEKFMLLQASLTSRRRILAASKM